MKSWTDEQLKAYLRFMGLGPRIRFSMSREELFAVLRSFYDEDDAWPDNDNRLIIYDDKELDWRDTVIPDWKHWLEVEREREHQRLRSQLGGGVFLVFFALFLGAVIAAL